VCSITGVDVGYFEHRGVVQGVRSRVLNKSGIYVRRSLNRRTSMLKQTFATTHGK
jgi:hypothetical protein